MPDIPPGVISYNEFWYERGNETIESRRTSLIYDPPNGRVPPSNEIGRQRRAEYGQMVFESAGPEGRTTVDRCITGFVGGPPMIPGSYNNNMQLVQTKDHVMILNEMVHTARIIPFADEHSTKQNEMGGRFDRSLGRRYARDPHPELVPHVQLAWHVESSQGHRAL